MSIELDPLIQQKLRSFAERRRRLIITRGVLAAITMLLLTMLVIAAIDFQWVLPEWLRWSLSGVAYLAVIVVVWRQCLAQLFHAPDARQLARLIEHAEPGLREDLLSAVELGQTRGEVFDSEQFRALLQSDVAHRMESMEVKSLLPVALIRRTIGYALAIGAAVFAMMVATGWQFRTLLLRAMLPGANLERVSRTKVSVLEPQNGDRIVPQGDTVRVVVELAGERASRARIETVGAKGGSQVTDMQPLGNDRFAATVQVGRESVRYQIRAGDAQTRKYLLDARERPYVTAFEKTFQYPAYSEIPARTIIEPEGSLVALEGTEVELKLKPNQAVKAAELRIEQGKMSSVVPLVAGADGRLSGKISLTASGSYRVHLVAAETEFENKFSPENELRAEPDLVPSVELEKPKSDLILPANELVDVAGSATDDFGLAKVSQAVKVNDGGWKETVLFKKPGKKTRIEMQWDLLAIGVKPGDLLTMKLVATDLKGNKGESRPLQVTITASGFEQRRLQSLDSLRALNESVRALAENADQLGKTARKANDEFQRNADNDTPRRQAVVEATGALTEFDTKFTEAWTTLGTALRVARAGHGGADLVMIGRSLSRLNTSAAKIARADAELLGANPAMSEGRALFAELADASTKAEQRAKQTAAAVEAITSAEEFGILVENSMVLVREQQRLMEMAAASGEDRAKWAPVVSRLRVALSQAKVIEELLEQIATRPGSPARDRAKAVMTEFRKRREDLSKALATTEPGARTLMRSAAEFTRVLQDFSRHSGSWHREFGFRPATLMQNLALESGAVYASIGKLVADVEALPKDARFPVETQLALLDNRWKTRTEIFKNAGDLEEIRPQADNHFVSDARNATLALEAMRAISAGTEKARLREKLGDIDAAFRVLESGHNLQECLDGFNHLAVSERWDLRSLASRTDAPRDWKWLETRLRVMPDELAKARPENASEDLKMAFTGAKEILLKSHQLPAWRGLDAEMAQRANLDRVPVTSRQDAEQLAGQVKLALDLLQKHMDEARRNLAKLSPTVSEFAAALAKEQAELKKETVEQAEKPETDVAKADAARDLAKQQQVNQKVETLKDLVRAEANKQDILNKDQREVMRDADDALAMLKEPPPKAEQALQDAAKDAPAQQKADLERAVEQQQKLADALQQIAKHFEAKEQGKPLDETRTALREAEKELGVKEQLDQQQAHAQMLAEMAQKPAAELLKELEAKLPENPAMQKELSGITKDALADAGEKLAQASKQENAVAKQVAEQVKRDEQPQRNAADAAKQAAEAAQAAKQAAETAQQQAKSAGNPQAEQQAAKAANEAATAAQAAQQAMQTAEQMAKAADPQQAAQAAQQTASKAGEAAKAAEQAMNDAKQAQNSAQQAAQKGGEHHAQNQQAGQKSAEAAQQAEKAAQAAKQAQALAQDAANQAAAMAQQNPQLAAGAKQQPAVAANAGDAATETERAGRHEARLGNQPAGEMLQELGKAIEATAQQQVPAAQQALANAKKAAEAQSAVGEANTQLAKELSALQNAANGQPQGQQPSPQAQTSAGQTPAQAAAQQSGQQAAQPAGQQSGQSAQQATAVPATPAEQQAMARALDALDQQLNASANPQAADPQAAGQPGQQPGQPGQQPGQPGQQPGQPGQQPGQPGDGKSPSQSAMAQAAQAAADSMRQSRAESSSTQPGSILSANQSDKSLGGAKADGAALAAGKLPDALGLKRGDWGKLPKRLADQLTKGSQEAIPGDYRQAVETYYRVLAEKAKKQ